MVLCIFAKDVHVKLRAKNKFGVMYWHGILIGLLSFVIIGIFHPLVIKTEYYLGRKSWWIYLVAGIIFIIISLHLENILIQSVAALTGFACFWTIIETFDQEKRVQKGWFPANPKRKGKVFVRQETAQDYDSIRRINEQAFGQLDEAFLIEKLRKRDDFNPDLSLVAVKNNIVVGHILFSPAKVISPLRKEHEIAALAPMAVFPDFQKQGIGSILVEEGLKQLKKQGYNAVAVLGHPAFYQRFGFSSASKFEIKCPYECPDEAFMVNELAPGSLSEVEGVVEYPKEFNIFS